MFWLTLFIVGVTYIIYKWVKFTKCWAEKGVKQIGFFESCKFLFHMESLLDSTVSTYNADKTGRYVGSFQFATPILFIKDPELIRSIGIKDFDNFTDHRPFMLEGCDPVLGKNLVFLTGDRWHEMRSTISPTFTSSKMKQMFVLMNEIGEQFVNYFLKQDKSLIEIELKDNFSRFSNDVIASTAFGIKIDSLENRENEFYTVGKVISGSLGFWQNLKFLGFILMPKVMKFFGVTVFSKTINNFFRSLVEDSIKTREKNQIVRPDLINILMEAKKQGTIKPEDTVKVEHDAGFAVAEESTIKKRPVKKIEMSLDDMTAQTLVFFFAGFETVSTAMCFAVHELALNPEVQEKLYNEILEVRKNNDKLTYDALSKMKYLDMVVSETLRKWPSAVATDRKCIKPYTIQPVNPGEKPVNLVVGDIIIFPIVAVHRDPNYWPDPERFNPERFNDENKDNIRPYTYLPFGVGPRNCVGSRFALLELKALLYHLIGNFEVVQTEKTPNPMIVSKKMLNLAPDGGFWVGFKRRS